MPGLIGKISKTKLDAPSFEKMIESIRHERWYKVDRYINGNLGIARVHLDIFNPQPQPIFNEDKSLCIFMDGKIYGYEKEMQQLRNKRHKFAIGNDAEFCLHLYEESGNDFVKNLNGAFVIVIYDLKENRVTIVNDRYGLKPLYYTKNNLGLIFASEMKAILKDKTFKKEINNEAVTDLFSFGDILGNKTFFKNIEVLPPASVSVYDGRNLSIKQYWDFDYKPDYDKSENEFVDELIKIFKKAVKIRMDDNNRYGVSLSGGLDSRTVVAAIDKDKRKKILSFSFGPLDCDEVKIARKVAERTGTKFKTIPISPEMIVENAKKTTYLSDGLTYIGNSFTPPIAKTFRENIDVILDGYALDLTLGGSYLNKKRLDTKSPKNLFNILYKKRLFLDEELNALFIENYHEAIKKYPLLSFRNAFKEIKPNHPANMSDHFALQNHVRRSTIMGIVLAQNYVEYSHPTYDNDFIDLILTIPPKLRFNHYIYRKFLKKLSPELARVPYNKTMIRVDAPLFLWKVGKIYCRIKESTKKRIWKFSKGGILLPDKRSYINFSEWLSTNKAWQKYFKELLLNRDALIKKYIKQEYIKKMLQEHKEGKYDNSTKIFYIATFELFLQLFVKEEKINI